MDLTFSDDLKMLVESLDRTLADHYSFQDRKTNEQWDRNAWDLLTELGVLGIHAPESVGGFDLGPSGVLTVYEALGKALVIEPLIQSAIVSTQILSKADQAQDILENMIRGQNITVLAHDEQHKIESLQQLSTNLQGTDNGYVLTGKKVAIEWANQADYLLVTALLNEAPVIVLVKKDSEQIKIDDYQSYSGAYIANVTFEQVQLNEEQIIAKGEQAELLYEEACHYGILASCSHAAGAMSKLLDLTKEYLLTRQQFNQPLANFQALQHDLADMYVATEEAISLCYVINAALDSSDLDKQRQLVSLAKIKMSALAMQVAEAAVQLHGGMGMTDELIIGDYFKSLSYLEFAFGDIPYHLERAGKIDTPLGIWN